MRPQASWYSSAGQCGVYKTARTADEAQAEVENRASFIEEMPIKEGLHRFLPAHCQVSFCGLYKTLMFSLWCLRVAAFRVLA